MDDDDPQAYIDQLARSVGKWPRPSYVPDLHKLMARNDLRVLKAFDALDQATFGESRSLDPKMKELLVLAMFTVLRAGKEPLTTHVQKALDLGASDKEILETIELALPVAGIVSFLAGFDAWREVTKAEGIEPSVAAG